VYIDGFIIGAPEEWVTSFRSNLVKWLELAEDMVEGTVITHKAEDKMYLYVILKGKQEIIEPFVDGLFKSYNTPIG